MQSVIKVLAELGGFFIAGTVLLAVVTAVVGIFLVLPLFLIWLFFPWSLIILIVVCAICCGKAEEEYERTHPNSR